VAHGCSATEQSTNRKRTVTHYSRKEGIKYVVCTIRTYAVVKVIIQPKNMILVSRIMFVYKLEKLYLIKTLIKEVLVVLDNLNTNIHASM
jgi:hypothetical protein